MPTTKKESRGAAAPVAPQVPASQTRKPLSKPAGWGPLAVEPTTPFQGWSPPTPLETAETLAASAAATGPVKATRRRKGRTVEDIVKRFKRPDGRQGFTVRELCPVMHVAAESLRAGLKNPGRFSVNSVVALAGMTGEDPMILLSDILAEIRNRPRAKKAAEERPKGIKPKADEEARTSKKPKPSAAKAAKAK